VENKLFESVRKPHALMHQPNKSTYAHFVTYVYSKILNVLQYRHPSILTSAVYSRNILSVFVATTSSAIFCCQLVTNIHTEWRASLKSCIKWLVRWFFGYLTPLFQLRCSNTIFFMNIELRGMCKVAFVTYFKVLSQHFSLRDWETPQKRLIGSYFKQHKCNLFFKDRF
jgi:hypothetical protein